MQTLTIGRSQYTLKPTRDVGTLQDKFSKCTGKPKKPSLARERRDYPVFESGMSTASYVSLFEVMNGKHLTPSKAYFAPLNKDACTLYIGADVHELIDDLSDDAGDPVPANSEVPAWHPSVALLAAIDAAPSVDLFDYLADCGTELRGATHDQLIASFLADIQRTGEAVYWARMDSVQPPAPAPIAPVVIVRHVSVEEFDARAAELQARAASEAAAREDAPPTRETTNLNVNREHPELSNVFEYWRGKCDSLSEYQAHILECLKDVHAGIRAQGKYPYNSDAWPRIAALMVLRHGYPDASVEATEGGWFGTHCYMAGQTIRRREETKLECDAAASFNAGQIFQRLIFDDGKQVTGAHLLEMSDSGYHCKLSGKRGGSVVTITCTASSLQVAIDRARVRVQVLADQRARSKPAAVAPPPGDSQSVSAPLPVHSAPGQSDPLHDRPMPIQAAQTGFECLSDPDLRAYIEGCHRDQQFGTDFERAARELNNRKDFGAWTNPPTTKAAHVPMKPCDRPMAGHGLASYRARGRYGWIMIGASNPVDAMREAKLSTENPTDLQVWDGGTYAPCEAPPSGELKASLATPIRALRGAESHKQPKAYPSNRARATARADPPLRIPIGDPRSVIPARFATCYVLQP